MTYERDIVFSPQQQEAFSELIRERISALGWNRKEAAEAAGVSADKVHSLARTVPSGMGFGYFIKVMLALDLDLYDMASMLELDTEVKQLMEAHPENYPNARRNFSKDEKNPLDALVSTLPTGKQNKARSLIAAILEHV